MRSSQPRTQLGWGGIGLPTLLLIAAFASGCGAATEGEVPGGEDVAAAPAPSSSRVTTSSHVTTTSTRPTTTTKGVSMEPAPRFFTTATPSGVYQMDLGASSTLQIPRGTLAPDVRGDAVLVIEVASLAPQRSQQWELRAAEVGQTVISIEVDGHPISWTLVVTA